jgi:RNA polymerase sigma-70 factor (ECF subfamily)
MATQNDTALAEDQDLVRAALREPKAYAQIVRRYEAPLTRYVGRMLGGSSPSTEDVLQEVFIKAFLNLNDYDPRRPFSPWIYRIAHNEAVSLLRRKRAEPQLISGEEGRLILDRIAAEEPDAAKKLDAARMDERLQAAIDGLGTRYRDVIVLRFLEEKTYDDISDILELPMGTVATLVSRGKQQLRKALDQSRRDDGTQA